MVGSVEDGRERERECDGGGIGAQSCCKILKDRGHYNRLVVYRILITCVHVVQFKYIGVGDYTQMYPLNRILCSILCLKMLQEEQKQGVPCSPLYCK